MSSEKEKRAATSSRSSDPLGSDPGDTTTWAANSAPPVILEEEDDDMETLVVTARPDAAPLEASSEAQAMWLERVEPALGRGERTRLDVSDGEMTLGRSEASDIRLYTASASREHASIEENEAGQWVLTPASGKSVLVDGEETCLPVVLEVGMNVVLGRDHLRCVIAGLESGGMEAPTAADGLGGSRGWFRGSGRGGRRWVLLGVVALIGVGLFFYIYLRG